MAKAKVLGHDPLAWIKSTRTEGQNGASDGHEVRASVAVEAQVPKEQEAPTDQVQAELVNVEERSVDSSGAVVSPPVVAATVVAEETEEPSRGLATPEPESGTQPARTFEIRSVAEYLSEKLARTNVDEQEEQGSTGSAEAHPQGLFGAVLLVIAVLLVALGYIAYSDAMGRIERLNKKVRQIEHQMPVPLGHEVNF